MLSTVSNIQSVPQRQKKCRKLSTPLNFQRSPKKDISLNRHEIEGPRVGKKNTKDGRRNNFRIKTKGLESGNGRRR